MMPMLAATFQSEGALTEYQMTGGSGRFTWSSFCPTCGSSISRRNERMSDYIYVHAASLDQPERYRPANNIYTDAAQPWDVPQD